MSFSYSVYGMIVRSEFELPELRPFKDSFSERSGLHYVYLRSGSVPEALYNSGTDDWTIQVRDAECLIRVKGLVRILVTAGQKVDVDVEQGATLEDAKVFIVGSALAAAAHQSGIVPLHVSAIRTLDGAIAFSGQSGAGKSTLAAYYRKIKGWPLISDDVATVIETERGFKIESGVRTVKLWKDALQSLGRSSDELTRDLQRLDKFHAIDADDFEVGQSPLKRLIYMEWGEEYSIRKLSGIEAFQTVLKCVYRPELAELCRNEKNVVSLSMRLASMVHIERLVRPKSSALRVGVSHTMHMIGNLGS